MSVVSFFFGAGSVLFLSWAFLSFEESTQSYIILGVISFLVGIVLIILVRMFLGLSYLLIGFSLGYFSTSLILTALNFSGENWMQIGIQVISGLVLGMICLALKNYIISLITAISGSFLFVYSIGFAMNKLESLFDLFERIQSGQIFSKSYLVFFIIFVVFSIFGYIFQLKTIYRKKQNKKDEKWIVRENLIEN